MRQRAKQAEIVLEAGGASKRFAYEPGTDSEGYAFQNARQWLRDQHVKANARRETAEDRREVIAKKGKRGAKGGVIAGAGGIESQERVNGG